MFGYAMKLKSAKRTCLSGGGGDPTMMPNACGSVVVPFNPSGMTRTSESTIVSSSLLDVPVQKRVLLRPPEEAAVDASHQHVDEIVIVNRLGQIESRLRHARDKRAQDQRRDHRIERVPIRSADQHPGRADIHLHLSVLTDAHDGGVVGGALGPRLDATRIPVVKIGRA